MDSDKTLKILKDVEFFDGLNDEELAQVCNIVKEVNLNKDQIIFQEGDIGDSFYLVCEGEVGILKNLHDLNETKATLIVMKPYDYFGEMSLLDNIARSATATAITDVKLFKMIKSDFLDLCLTNPKIIFHLIRTLSKRVRSTNEQFAHVMEELLKKNKLGAIGSAASKIVHDIKTPITIIVLTAQLIARANPKMKMYSERIIEQTCTVDSLIQEILSFAKGEESNLIITDVDVSKFFETIKKEVIIMIKTKNIKFDLKMNYVGKARFDEQKIERTILNIIKNSYEALSENGLITVIVEQSKDDFHISIEDNGPGIPDGLLKRIFEPFVSFGKEHGTGLGLAICKKVIADHKGFINVVNKEDNGVKFDIYLPFS